MASGSPPTKPSPSHHTRDVPAFVQTLFDVVSDPETDEIVTWNASSAGFVILDQKRFVASVLPRLCLTKSFETFVRQLHCYGFSKQRASASKPILIHHTEDLFRKGEPLLLKGIKRNRKKKSEPYTPADPLPPPPVAPSAPALPLPSPAPGPAPSPSPAPATAASPDVTPSLVALLPCDDKIDAKDVKAECHPAAAPAEPTVIPTAASLPGHRKSSRRSNRLAPSSSASLPPSSSSLPPPPSEDREERGRAPKVQRTIQVYQTFLTDALATMQQLLEQASASAGTGGNGEAVDVVSTVSRFVDRSAPLLSQLRPPDLPPSIDAPEDEGSAPETACASSLDAVSQQLSDLLSAINVSKRGGGEKRRHREQAPQASPPVPFSSSSSSLLLAPSSPVIAPSPHPKTGGAASALTLVGGLDDRLTPLLLKGRYLSKHTSRDSSSDSHTSGEAPAKAARAAGGGDAGSGATAGTGLSTIPSLPEFDPELADFLSQLELTSESTAAEGGPA